MAKNVTVRKGRGSGVTKEQESEFLYWLERSGHIEQAAIMARVAPSAMKMRRQRNARFRAAYDLAKGSKHKALVEDFFMRLEESADVRSSYLAAELTSGWYYSRMLRDPAFKARVERTCGIQPNALKKKVVTLAKASDNIPDLLKVLDRMMGNQQPTPPRGG